MARFAHFTLRLRLKAPAHEVWQRAISVSGIRDEMFPWLRMSLPAGVLPAEADNLQLGRCWLWLFGCLPVECDRLGLQRLRMLSFDERSSMLSQRRWWHRRRVVPLDASSCELVDRVAFVPRWRGLLPLSRRLVYLIFVWRHRRLARRYGLDIRV
ncbi:hypothetical protein [Vogesella sp. LIG4]|uniref:hypothetical protein n=1 Tax=Vogesella sp. LIG4 TaxID=1192162 RepID=UPI00081FFC24|nr:hypothetical protein [Vogesella sp. LIG4]SCK21383.1 hypothetical protein PSELUDRAFT_2427 [Vogesella sp. LIG4]